VDSSAPFFSCRCAAPLRTVRLRTFYFSTVASLVLNRLSRGGSILLSSCIRPLELTEPISSSFNSCFLISGGGMSVAVLFIDGSSPFSPNILRRRSYSVLFPPKVGDSKASSVLLLPFSDPSSLVGHAEAPPPFFAEFGNLCLLPIQLTLGQSQHTPYTRALPASFSFLFFLHLVHENFLFQVLPSPSGFSLIE